MLEDPTLFSAGEVEESLSLCDELAVVVQNSMFVCVALGYACNVAVVMGFATFGPIFLQVPQISLVSPRTSSLHTDGVLGPVLSPYLRMLVLFFSYGSSLLIAESRFF